MEDEAEAHTPEVISYMCPGFQLGIKVLLLNPENITEPYFKTLNKSYATSTQFSFEVEHLGSFKPVGPYENINFTREMSPQRGKVNWKF